MGYSGPVLGEVWDFVDSADLLCRDLADEGGSRMKDHTVESTPIGHRPFDEGYEPGHLLESIRQKIVVVSFSVLHGSVVYESGAETNVSYAPYVEEGTGLWGPFRRMYLIVPKNPLGWLRFHDQFGNVVFAKKVMHPGSPGAHMFAKGAALTDLEFHDWADVKVLEWTKKCEAEIEVRGRLKVARS